MDATVLIPLHHTQYKAIQNIHMGRDVRTEIPDEEREAFLALYTSYEIIYEYLVNKHPDRFTDGAKVVFEERKSVRDQKGTGKVLATVSKITTNYLGAKARVANILPKTEEVPKPPPKAEAVSETGAVSGAFAAAGGGAPVVAVVPQVKSETGAVEEGVGELVAPILTDDLSAYIRAYNAYLFEIHKRTVQAIAKLDIDIYVESIAKKEKERQDLLATFKKEIVDGYFAQTIYGFNYNPATQPPPFSTLAKDFKPLTFSVIEAFVRKEYGGISSDFERASQQFDIVGKRLALEQSGPISYTAKALLNSTGASEACQAWMGACRLYVQSMSSYLTTLRKARVKETYIQEKILGVINQSYASKHLRNLEIIVGNHLSLI